MDTKTFEKAQPLRVHINALKSVKAQILDRLPLLTEAEVENITAATNAAVYRLEKEFAAL